MSTLISYLYAQSNITKYVNVNVYPNISQRDIYEDKKMNFLVQLNLVIRDGMYLNTIL